MSKFDSSKNYYQVLGAEEQASRREIERLYKRLAALHHPDRGGSEEQMKALNEAYRVLRDEVMRCDYDSQRMKAAAPEWAPATVAPARDVGASGQALSAFLCLFVGLFLLVLVRAQWMFFLWPLAILALFGMVFGVFLAHAAMLSFNQSLSRSNPLRRHWLLPETVFWIVVVTGGVGLYLMLGMAN